MVDDSPARFIPLLGGGDRKLPGLQALLLVDPEAGQRVGLVVADRSPHSPVIEALLRTVRTLSVGPDLLDEPKMPA